MKLRLSKDQASLIWPGLNYIICQYLTRQRYGESLTCYPFAIQPLPPGFDSGTFSSQMMDRIQQLWIDVQAIKSKGGDVSVDEFGIRAAIFAARTSVKLERHRMRNEPRTAPNTKHQAESATRALKRQVARKEHTVSFLEKALKRASREFQKSQGAAEFRARSAEWRSHLRWMEFRLTYFKPFRPCRLSRRQMRQLWMKTLLGMAEKAIIRQGLKLPPASELRAVVAQFITYSLRGRIGQYNHVFMIHNEQDILAQSRLLAFIQDRLVLQVAT